MAKASASVPSNDSRAAAPADGAASRKSKPAAAPGPGDVRQSELRGEWVGIVLFGAGAALALALVSHDPRDMAIVAAGQGHQEVANWLGPVGARMADLLLHFLGLGAFLLDGLVLVLALATLTGRMSAPRPRVALGLAGASLSLLVLLHLVAQRWHWRPMGKDAAGLLPGGVAVVLKAMLSTTGTALLATMGLVAALAAITGKSLTSMFARWVAGRAAPVVEHAVVATGEAAKQGVANFKEKVGSAKLRNTAAANADSEPLEAVGAPATRAKASAAQQDSGRADTADAEARFFAELADEDRRWSEATPAPVVRFSGADLRFSEPIPELAETLVARRTAPVAPGTADAPAARPIATQKSAAQLTNGAGDDEPLESLDITDLPGDLPDHVPADSGRRQPMILSTQPIQTFQPPAPVQLSHAEMSRTAQMNALERDQVIAEFHSLERGEIPELSPGFVMPVVDDRVADPVPQRVQNQLINQVNSVDIHQSRPALPQAASAPQPPALQMVPPALGTTGFGPRIVETEALRNSTQSVVLEAVQQPLAIGGKQWVLPPSTLLQEPPHRALKLDEEAQRILRENAFTLEQKLSEFGIHGEVTDMRPGPVVTTYEYRPASGVKISKIVNLRDDLTMKLSALRVRVVAPIPGRDVVGIEVPNKQRQIVYFRDVLERPEFRDTKSPLTLILGKDIEGKPLLMDLAKAPHLLVAGATGTGKSVGINSFICSLLFRCTPDECRLILIDPKILELSSYADIPHLLLPVLDDPRKAELALKWACTEMDRRYKMMSEVGVRNLASYKQKVPEIRQTAQRQHMMAGDVGEVAHIEDPPYIVVVIDEFADLIMQQGKEVEIPVARLAQKARAAGIHVVLATQRPSTDVLTGMIKANFATRVSFQVASSIDSKVVLNQIGAETLLGRGDMLLVPPGEGHLKRCHGTWITDDEVLDIAKHWRDQGTPRYEMDILKDPETEAAEDGDDGESDALYDDAVQVVIEAGQASVSFLQRKLGIGYGRAARMIDTMAARGIIGPSRGPNKPRDILVNSL
jgi:S-DNA-T family DNA segregation ATPase FtsK/SpoIIIE